MQREVKGRYSVIKTYFRKAVAQKQHKSVEH